MIQAAWGRFRIKICWLIRYTQAKHFLTTMLGTEVFLATYQGLRRSQEPRQATPVTRVLQGKVVGKPKTPSETVQPTVSAKDCLHQEQCMKWRANKHAAWWTCVACGSRWEGHTLGKFTPMDEPEGSELVLFGKHAGKTFQWVANNVPKYLEWVVMTADNDPDCCESLTRLARWAAIREWQAASSLPRKREEPPMDVQSDSGSNLSGWMPTDPPNTP